MSKIALDVNGKRGMFNAVFLSMAFLAREKKTVTAHFFVTNVDDFMTRIDGFDGA